MAWRVTWIYWERWCGDNKTKNKSNDVFCGAETRNIPIKLYGDTEVLTSITYTMRVLWNRRKCKNLFMFPASDSAQEKLTRLLWTKWPLFRRRCLQMHIPEWKFCILFRISLKFVPKSPIGNKSVLVQIMLGAEQATSHFLNQCWLR